MAVVCGTGLVVPMDISFGLTSNIEAIASIFEHIFLWDNATAFDLDVVPEGDNWTHPPFSGTIVDNKIYGRGSIDDKGPVISSLYAISIFLGFIFKTILQVFGTTLIALP